MRPSWVAIDHAAARSASADGVLAVFRAPIELEDHADRALAAAREMVGVRLARFNRGIREQGLGTGFAMGIGLNSGHFMSGDVGSALRLEYTVHGDAVNTAARLQEMTKSARHSVLVSESVREALLRPPSDLAFVGDVEVRGRRSTIGLWTPASVGRPVAVSGPRELVGTRERD